MDVIIKFDDILLNSCFFYSSQIKKYEKTNVIATRNIRTIKRVHYLYTTPVKYTLENHFIKFRKH